METWLPLATFAFVSSITPGPNNVMLSVSGVAFGLRRTLPHLFGVWTGFALLLALCGAGVGALLERFPPVALGFKLAGSAYLLWFAWMLRSAFAARERAGHARPMAYREAVAFQFVNPKAWLMATTAAAVFAPNLEPRWLAVLWLCVVFSTVNFPCILSWAAVGASLQSLLEGERRQRAFGWTIAVLMAYSVAMLWL